MVLEALIISIAWYQNKYIFILGKYKILEKYDIFMDNKKPANFLKRKSINHMVFWKYASEVLLQITLFQTKYVSY